jgi:hypothetical protein
MCEVRSFREIHPTEATIQPKRYCVPQAMCPYLLTHCNQTKNVCGAWVESARYEVSGKPLQWKLQYLQYLIPHYEHNIYRTVNVSNGKSCITGFVQFFFRQRYLQQHGQVLSPKSQTYAEVDKFGMSIHVNRSRAGNCSKAGPGGRAI